MEIVNSMYISCDVRPYVNDEASILEVNMLKKQWLSHVNDEASILEGNMLKKQWRKSFYVIWNIFNE